MSLFLLVGRIWWVMNLGFVVIFLWVGMVVGVVRVVVVRVKRDRNFILKMSGF